MRQFRRELKALEAPIVHATGEALRKAYRAGLRAAEKQAVQAGVAPAGSSLKGDFNLVDRRRAEVLSRVAAGDLVKGVRSIGGRTERLVRQVHAAGLNDRAVNRLLAGDTLGVQGSALALQQLRETVQKVAGKHASQKGGKQGFITIRNRRGGTTHIEARAYADMVYQTKLAEATNIATVERLREKNIDLVRVIGSNSRNYCTRFVGKVFSIGGKSPEWPALARLNGAPPFHPRCTKTLVAFVPRLASEKQLAAARLGPAEEELLGEPPAEAQRAFDAASKPPAPAKPTPTPTPAAPPTPKPASVATPPSSAAEEVRAATNADPEVLARYEQDRTRRVVWQGPRPPEKFAARLGVDRPTLELLVHSAVPGNDGLFAKLHVHADRKTGGILLFSRAPGGLGVISRQLYREGGALVCRATGFDLARPLRGRHLGLRIFHATCLGLRAAGVERIEALAQRSRVLTDEKGKGRTRGRRNRQKNGYYTWAVFGYEAKLSSLSRHVRERVAAEAKAGSIDISDDSLLSLVGKPEGRKLWKQHGGQFEGTFDLREGSRSRLFLLSYLRSVQRRGRKL